jgi:hypothetical protein
MYMTLKYCSSKTFLVWNSVQLTLNLCSLQMAGTDVMSQTDQVSTLLEAATYALTRPQLNTEVGAEARRIQQVLISITALSYALVSSWH